ncbi:MAG: hypothetical protein WB630_20645 [Candidatus Acidiferrales bacterium]
MKQLAELKQQGHDPTKVLEQSIACGYPGFHPLRENGNRNLTDNEKLGLSRSGIHSTADHNALLIRNAEALDWLEKGTYQKIKKELLATGGNFEDDERVIAMCEEIGKHLSLRNVT